jgi:hypothetical protein
MNPSPKGTDVDSIIDEYNIDVESTSPIRVRGADSATSIFKIDRPDLIEELYIVDTEQGRRIACHPHIVGEELKALALDAALEAAKAIEQLTDLSEKNKDCIVFENVLRAAPGYELQAALKEVHGRREFRNVWIRSRYEKPSYRDHDEEPSTRLNIVYEDFEALPCNREIVVLKPDTEATGKTGQISIDRIVEKCKDVGSRIEKVILYGFISVPGLKRISQTAQKYDIALAALSIGNVTDLADNGYDMTLYGIDESYWKSNGEVRKLGSIVDSSTLNRYLPIFVPGSDQPGDWSNRQTTIHMTKEKTEQGAIAQHLQNSIELIKSLKRISDYEQWQQEIAEKELQLLFKTLKEHPANTTS